MLNTDRDITRTRAEFGVTRLDNLGGKDELWELANDLGWLDEDDKADEHNEKDR